MLTLFYEKGGLDSNLVESTTTRNIKFQLATVNKQSAGRKDLCYEQVFSYYCFRFEKLDDDDEACKSLYAKNANSEEDASNNQVNSEAQLAEIKSEAEHWMRWPQVKIILNIREPGSGETNKAKLYISPNRVTWLNDTRSVIK